VPVHGGERLLVLDLHPVLALEVDDLDRVGGGEVLAQGEIPGRGGVELEVDVGVAGEAAVDRVGRGRIAEAERVDESAAAAARAPSTSCSGRPAWRSARSSAADSNDQLRHRRKSSHSGGSCHCSTVPRWSQKDSSVHSPASDRRGTFATGSSSSGMHADVLAEALVAAAVDPHQDRRPGLAVGHLGAQRVELVALDDEWQVGEFRPQAHPGTVPIDG
jgi:hypothetical protein